MAAEVTGPLGESHYVVDFLVVREMLRGIVGPLDHRLLLPTESPLIRIRAEENEVVATFDDRRWVFPRGDCVLLGVANTTAERLAEYIGRRLLEAFGKRSIAAPSKVRIEVEETAGQSGIWRRSSD